MVYSGIVLGAGSVYRVETVQTAQVGYIQECISEVAVGVGKIRERKCEVKKHLCQALCVAVGERRVENI